MQYQRLGQEHHRERLARSGRMPDHTAFASAVSTAATDPLDQRAYAEELLVARHHLAHLAVEQHEEAQEFQQARRRQQAHQ